MAAAEGDIRFSELCLELFFGTLLGVKASGIVVGIFAGTEFSTGTRKITFGFANPLLRERIHRVPCLVG
jgi:hypothetical protein